MRPAKILYQLAAFCGWVIFTGFGAQAETLSGTVLDPQQRVIIGAPVSLSCIDYTDTRATDNEGHFFFTRQAFQEPCTVEAGYPGFATLKVILGEKRVLTLELRLAELKETVVAKDELTVPRSMASISLSADDLRRISNNSDDPLS